VPYRLNDTVIELPCAGEYAWEPSRDTLPAFMALAEKDMEGIHDAGGVFILMCHQQKVGQEDGLPREVLAHIFAHARRHHDARFLTLRDLAGLIDSGTIPAAASGRAVDACGRGVAACGRAVPGPLPRPLPTRTVQ
jgi:hypothetical protein